VDEKLQQNDSDYKSGEKNWFFPLFKVGFHVAMESDSFSPLTG